jgi:hypothetical protein
MSYAIEKDLFVDASCPLLCVCIETLTEIEMYSYVINLLDDTNSIYGIIAMHDNDAYQGPY